MKGFLIRLMLFVLVLTISAELFFRFVVPASQFPSYRTHGEYSVLQLDSHTARDGIFTSGRLARDRADWHVNDQGWNSRIDFKRPADRDLPCIAMFGDSYIEGFLNGLDDHIDSFLAERLEGRYEVYGMGVSGAIFGHYIQMARYARDQFAPEMMVFFINNGDLKASLAEFGRRPLFRQFRHVDGGFTELPVSRHRSNRLKKVLKRSALVRYVKSNANLNLFGGMVDEEATAIERARDADEREERLLRQFAQYATRLLRDEHPETEFIFLFDANRRQLYAEDGLPLRLYDSLLLEQPATDAGIHVLDLTRTFHDDYRANGVLLNFDYNYHWNRRGNRLAADALGDLIEELIQAE